MIRLENVSKTIKGRTVIDKVSLYFKEGTVYGLKGINGSGKTMLMRLISGLIYPTEGKVFVGGKQLGKDISFPEDMGVLIENPAFLNNYTGFENLCLLAALNGKIGKKEITDTLKKVGLNPDDKRKYRKYSLGMKQRLGIAASIMENPRILVLDEPLNALDTDGISLFTKIIEEEKKKGTLIILSCHEEEKLRQYADVIITLENAKVISQEGEKHEQVK